MGMIAITCELCGSNELTRREDGLFQCDHCGTKYTLEAARQLMQGATVSIDRAPEAQNLLIRAKQFYEDREFEKTIEYCNRALDLEPSYEEALRTLKLAKLLMSDNVFLTTSYGLNYHDINIYVDDAYVGSIKKGQTMSIHLEPGHYLVYFMDLDRDSFEKKLEAFNAQRFKSNRREIDKFTSGMEEITVEDFARYDLRRIKPEKLFGSGSGCKIQVAKTSMLD